MRLPLLALLLSLSAVPAAAFANDLPGDSVYQVSAQFTDQDGRARAWQDLRGRPKVVSMFYANCHLMCPLIIESGKALQKQLSRSQYADLDLVMLSLDPARDTPAALTEVIRTHRLDPERWQLLRPQDRDVRTLAAALDIRYRAQPDGTFNHTSVLILLDAEGRPLARSEVTGLRPDPDFVTQVKRALAAAPATAQP